VTHLQVTYEIESLAPLHIGTGYGQAGVVDLGTVRRMQAGRPGAVFVPGSSIKGRARFRVEQIAPRLAACGAIEPFEWSNTHRDRPCRSAPFCPVCNLFGSPARPGTLFFSDATLALECAVASRVGPDADEEVRALYEREVRPNVMLSRRRRVALERHLFTTEVAAAGLRYRGTVDGYVDDQGRTLTICGQGVPADLALLVAALHAISHLGGHKSRGLGACRVRVTEIELDGAPSCWSADDLLRVWLKGKRE